MRRRPPSASAPYPNPSQSSPFQSTPRHALFYLAVASSPSLQSCRAVPVLSCPVHCFVDLSFHSTPFPRLHVGMHVFNTSRRPVFRSSLFILIAITTRRFHQGSPKLHEGTLFIGGSFGFGSGLITRTPLQLQVSTAECVADALSHSVSLWQDSDPTHLRLTKIPTPRRTGHPSLRLACHPFTLIQARRRKRRFSSRVVLQQNVLLNPQPAS